MLLEELLENSTGAPINDFEFDIDMLLDRTNDDDNGTKAMDLSDRQKMANVYHHQQLGTDIQEQEMNASNRDSKKEARRRKNRKRRVKVMKRWQRDMERLNKGEITERDLEVERRARFQRGCEMRERARVKREVKAEVQRQLIHGGI